MYCSDQSIACVEPLSLGRDFTNDNLISKGSIFDSLIQVRLILRLSFFKERISKCNRIIIFEARQFEI